MSDWVWFIAYERGERHIVLADRDTIGSLCDAAGGALLNASWPWRIRVGRLTHRVAVALIDAAERRTRTVAKIPASREVLGELHRLGLLDEDWDDAPTDAPTPVREVSE